MSNSDADLHWVQACSCWLIQCQLPFNRRSGYHSLMHRPAILLWLVVFCFDPFTWKREAIQSFHILDWSPAHQHLLQSYISFQRRGRLFISSYSVVKVCDNSVLTNCDTYLFRLQIAVCVCVCVVSFFLKNTLIMFRGSRGYLKGCRRKCHNPIKNTQTSLPRSYVLPYLYTYPWQLWPLLSIIFKFWKNRIKNYQ